MKKIYIIFSAIGLLTTVFVAAQTMSVSPEILKRELGDVCDSAASCSFAFEKAFNSGNAALVKRFTDFGLRYKLYSKKEAEIVSTAPIETIVTKAREITQCGTDTNCILERAQELITAAGKDQKLSTIVHQSDFVKRTEAIKVLTTSAEDAGINLEACLDETQSLSDEDEIACSKVLRAAAKKSKIITAAIPDVQRRLEIAQRTEHTDALASYIAQNGCTVLHPAIKTLDECGRELQNAFASGNPAIIKEFRALAASAGPEYVRQFGEMEKNYNTTFKQYVQTSMPSEEYILVGDAMVPAKDLPYHSKERRYDNFYPYNSMGGNSMVAGCQNKYKDNPGKLEICMKIAEEMGTPGGIGIYPPSPPYPGEQHTITQCLQNKAWSSLKVAYLEAMMRGWGYPATTVPLEWTMEDVVRMKECGAPSYFTDSISAMARNKVSPICPMMPVRNEPGCYTESTPDGCGRELCPKDPGYDPSQQQINCSVITPAVRPCGFNEKPVPGKCGPSCIAGPDFICPAVMPRPCDAGEKPTEGRCGPSCLETSYPRDACGYHKSATECANPQWAMHCSWNVPTNTCMSRELYPKPPYPIPELGDYVFVGLDGNSIKITSRTAAMAQAAAFCVGLVRAKNESICAQLGYYGSNPPYPTIPPYPGGQQPPAGQREQVWNAYGLRSWVRTDADQARIERLKEGCKNVPQGTDVWMGGAGTMTSLDFGMPDPEKCRLYTTPPTGTQPPITYPITGTSSCTIAEIAAFQNAGISSVNDCHYMDSSIPYAGAMSACLKNGVVFRDRANCPSLSVDGTGTYLGTNGSCGPGYTGTPPYCTVSSGTSPITGTYPQCSSDQYIKMSDRTCQPRLNCTITGNPEYNSSECQGVRMTLGTIPLTTSPAPYTCVTGAYMEGAHCRKGAVCGAPGSPEASYTASSCSDAIPTSYTPPCGAGLYMCNGACVANETPCGSLYNTMPSSPATCGTGMYWYTPPGGGAGYCQSSTSVYTPSSPVSVMPTGGCPSGQYWNGYSCITSPTYISPTETNLVTCPPGYTGTPPNCTVTSSGTYTSSTSCPSGYTGIPPHCTVSSTMTADEGCKQTYGVAASWNGSKCIGGTSPTASIIDILRFWFSR